MSVPTFVLRVSVRAMLVARQFIRTSAVVIGTTAGTFIEMVTCLNSDFGANRSSGVRRPPLVQSPLPDYCAGLQVTSSQHKFRL